MTVSGIYTWMEHSLRMLGRRVAEVTHIAAVYLGIAVLVTVALSFVVPSLRDQSQQIHAALLVSLKPGLPGEGEDGVSLRQRLSGASMVLRPDGDAGTPGESDAPQTFAEALGALDSFSIPGVTK